MLQYLEASQSRDKRVNNNLLTIEQTTFQYSQWWKFTKPKTKMLLESHKHQVQFMYKNQIEQADPVDFLMNLWTSQVK